MARLKPWYKVVTPREDLREGRPLDASEFAVHLDQIRDGRAHIDYQKPERFFERTYLTRNLLGLSAEVCRRLTGQKTETSSIFNMSTQFGGGKTHALTLLYHLASHGPSSEAWMGVSRIKSSAGIKQIPKSRTAVFVGTEFDSIQGRGGDNSPVRKTPWGEIAYQLLGDQGFEIIKEHEKQMIAPAGDVIRKLLPKDKPCLILVDELLNYISRNRKSGLSTQLYNFIQNLSEEIRGSGNAVLVISIPASELEMTPDDRSDYERFKKLLDRLGKAVIMSAEEETSEIIRRRLFEWDLRAQSTDGRILLPKDADAVCNEYADWVSDHRQQLPNWFADHAREAFKATYPFHPMALSVFERKWQELPRFQQTRGILRLLALWVSDCYQQGFKGALKELLICPGSAPLHDEKFRAAVFEQLGESRLEGALTTDICGKKESHAVRLDAESVDTIKKTKLHRKVSSVIFYESNGGQTKQFATVPEIRMALGGPNLDIGNVETALDSLVDVCYYLTSERNQYKFTLKENLNKRFADRKANVKDPDIDEKIREEIQKVFPATVGVERVFFPDKSGQIPDRPVITFIVMAPDNSIQDDSNVKQNIETMTKEYGKSARTYKSALIWVVPESVSLLKEEARNLIAWNDIADENLKLDDSQNRQLNTNLKKAKSNLKESVWRTYKNVLLLDKDNTLRLIDLGLPTSSSAESMCKLILLTLQQTDEVQKMVSPRFLIRNWPPAFTEWSTKSVRDAFYASPKFPRLLNTDAIKDMISRGVSEGHLAYVGKLQSGEYSPFYYKKSIDSLEIEISDDVYIISSEEAEKHIKPPKLAKIIVSPSQVDVKPDEKQTFTVKGLDQFNRDFDISTVEWSTTGGEIDSNGVFYADQDKGNFIINAKSDNVTGSASIKIAEEVKPFDPSPPDEEPTQPERLNWSGEVEPLKWMNLYTKVLTKFVKKGSLKVNVNIEAIPSNGIDDQLIEETKAALRELGLNDNVKTD
ncbi:MAG: ATPase AAA [Candidatus Magnetoglobus multicellularis str. Araruama]|uniref:ATPase AAA n=1 Tax=Candidatus Magnetoglobus multicellularis str. Araruama TaxID=890399 RepID=A0A1V1PCU3_9BACT|nr:MAG: ATPase AAA [Candidatus Magnetoglobus multicellularis str. Araruama]